MLCQRLLLLENEYKNETILTYSLFIPIISLVYQGR